MTPPDDDARSAVRPLSVLRQRDFRPFALSQLFAVAATTMVQAAIAWHVFAITGSVFQLGVLGLVRLGPSLGLGLIGGSVADSYDRRGIVMVSQLAAMACTVALWVTSGADSLALIYPLVFVMAMASAFENPARQALLPLLVPRWRFQGAVTVSTAVQQVGFVSGPAAAGLLLASSGVGAAYLGHAVLLGMSVVFLAMLAPRAPEHARSRIGIAAIGEGVRFVLRRQVLLGAMVLDLFAVILGGATALLPVYANEILGVGATGYGLLAASAEFGALLVAIALVTLPPIRGAGRMLLLTVVVYGAGTVVFGLSRDFALSLTAFMVTGMADQVSVVLRHTMIQMATPDELRGRVSSVNVLFTGASNQLAAIESGFVAALTTATFAVVSGGAGCLLVVAAVAAWMPGLRRYRIVAASPASPTVPAAGQ